MNFDKQSLEEHKKHGGKVATESKVPLNNKDDLSMYYTPWVAAPCLEIAEDSKKAYDYTRKNNSVAVISDGSAVLWLWNIWWLAWLPVMEGKCILMKEFAGLDAIPIVLDTQDPDEIISIVKHLAPTFGAINLEDISAPNCFYIEETLKDLTDIPVFHDDQHGTAIVVLAALINGLKVVDKDIKDLKIVIAWAWAAGTAIAKLLRVYGATNIVTLDSKWTLTTWRDRMNPYKDILATYNADQISGSLSEVMTDADVFVWVSRPNILTRQDVEKMNSWSMVFALSNPDPEITMEEAIKGWATIYGAWRSDVPVQINNLIAFPGILRWAIDARIHDITSDHKLAAALALANAVTDPSTEKLLPDSLDKEIAYIVAEAVKKVKNKK